MMKLAITGRFRRGKDTLADAVEKELGSETVARIAFASGLKHELAELTYLYTHPEEKFVHREHSARATYEQFAKFKTWMGEFRHVNGAGWQWWGEYRRQTEGEDYWIKHPIFRKSVREALESNKHMILTDMRHRNEAEWCASEGFYRVRVIGPCRAEGETRDPEHPSERHIDDLDIDEEFENIWIGLHNVDAFAERLVMKLHR